MAQYTPAQPAQGGPGRSRLWRAALAVLSLGMSLRESWQERPGRRIAILAGVACYWSLGWLLAVAAMLLIPGARPLFLPLALALTGLFAAGVFAAAGGQATARRLALAALGLPGAWLLAMAALLYVNDGLFFLRDPLLCLLAGWLLIGALWVLALLLPLWGTLVRCGEVYLIRQPITVHAEGFTLHTRPVPTIPPELTAALHQAGIPAHMLLNFLHFNGPQPARRLLNEQVGPGQQHLLAALYQTVDAQTAAAAPLWMSALNRVRLFWNTLDNIAMDITVREVVTEGGHPVDLRLRFVARFDPTIVADAEFYVALGDCQSRGALRQMLHALLARAAETVVQQAFIGVAWEAALADASVEDFRHQFLAQMDWTLNLGISVNPRTVQCSPVFTPRMLDAEEALRASRAEGRTQAARLNALVDRVMKEAVPRELLAAMMFLDQGERLTLNWPAGASVDGGALSFAQMMGVDAPGQQRAAPPLIQSSARVLPAAPPRQAGDSADDWTQSGADYTLQTLIQRRRQRQDAPR